MRRFLKKLKERELAVCIVALSAAVILMGWSVYWYRQWQAWHAVNVSIMQSLPQIKATGDRAEWLAQWQGRHHNIMDIVQDEGQRQGLVVLSLTGTYGAKSYDVECSGTFSDLVNFLNGLERYDPPVAADVVEIAGSDAGIVSTIRVKAYV
jgi:hypothetical protein